MTARSCCHRARSDPTCRATSTDRAPRDAHRPCASATPMRRAIATALRPLVASDPFELVRITGAHRPRATSAGGAPRARRRTATARRRATPGDAQPRGGTNIAGPGLALGRVRRCLSLAVPACWPSLASDGDRDPRRRPQRRRRRRRPGDPVAVFDPYGSIREGQTEPFAAVDGDPHTAGARRPTPCHCGRWARPGLGHLDRRRRAPRAIDVRGGGPAHRWHHRGAAGRRQRPHRRDDRGGLAQPRPAQPAG